MLMTLPIDQVPVPPTAPAEPQSFAETQRLVEAAVANRAREKETKDQLRLALYRRMIDAQLRPGSQGPSGNSFRSAGRVAICGFVAFLIVLWALGPASLDAVEAVLAAAAASVSLGLVSLAIVALCERAGRHPSDPADPHADGPQPVPRKDEKALRRLF